MAEKVMVVCDVCGAPAIESARISTGSRNVVKDLCAVHLAELLAGAHAPRRGRPRSTTSPAAASAATASAPKRRGRPPKVRSEAPGTKRRGRPPKAQASGSEPPAVSAEAAKPERRRITDPVILDKRRASLAKVRQARADKRAAANATG